MNIAVEQNEVEREVGISRVVWGRRLTTLNKVESAL